MPDLKELQQALDDDRREIQNLTVMGMRPDLKPNLVAQDASFARCSIRAIMILRQLDELVSQ